MVVGFNITSATTSEGFLENAGVFTFLQFPGSVFTQGLGLNNNGEIVGAFMDAAGNSHGFLYNIAAATYQQVDDPHAVGPGGTVINGLNDKGQIVGFFTDANGNVDGLVGTAPPVLREAAPQPPDSRGAAVWGFFWPPSDSGGTNTIFR
jgi:probable HAF family extracellular repeat protein